MGDIHYVDSSGVTREIVLDADDDLDDIWGHKQIETELTDLRRRSAMTEAEREAEDLSIGRQMLVFGHGRRRYRNLFDEPGEE